MKLGKYKEKLEYLIPCFYFVLFFVLLQVMLDHQGDVTIRSYIFILMAADVVLFFRALKKLRRKRKKSFLKRLVNRLRDLGRYFRTVTKKVAAKLGIRRNLVYIRGKDKIEFAFGEIRRSRAQEEKKRKPAMSKWKDLQNNRERVRFIYIVFLKKCIKRGFRFDRTMTPADIAERVAETPGQRRIFACYNDARYGDARAQVPDGVVKELLQEIKMHKGGA